MVNCLDGMPMQPQQTGYVCHREQRAQALDPGTIATVRARRT